MSRAWAFIGIGILVNALARVVQPEGDWIGRLPLVILYAVAAAGIYLYLIERIEAQR